ncbi:tyrosine-type recombinase/integrase [Hymenobacter sp. B81]|uniref:tyrosine-type recombinase/integrase n=1 Tax=Hymenobacter sp. B81 TaxID=3344878 RepID=UPI0037DC7578
MKAAVSLRLREGRTTFQVFFPYSDAALRTALLAAGVCYEAGARGYVLPATPEAVEPLRLACQQLGMPLHVPQVPALAIEMAPPTPHQVLLTRYCQQIVLKRYSPQTLKSYRHAFQQFLTYCGPRQPLELSRQDVLDYLSLRLTAGISEAYQNLLINAIKFYYEQVENQPRQHYTVPRPKLPLTNPKVLAKEEVRHLLQSTDNLKHRAMLMLAYGLSLRLGEVLALTPQDIDSRRMALYVRGGKGKKDRDLPLPESLLHLLREQFRQFRPTIFLFEGQQPGEPYSARSLQQVIKQAAERAGIRRSVTLHMLRHSYATHLLEADTDIRVIQNLLGHSSIKTTEIYTHVVQHNRPASPLDSLGL